MSHLSVPDFPAAGQASTAISLPAPSALASHSAQAQVAQASQVALTVQAAQASHEPPGVPRCKESPGTPRCKESPGAPRCAIYIRVSTSEQKIHGKSLAAQREYLLAYAATHGFQVVGIYADEGKTARKELRRRKAVHALLADARDGNIDLILFWKMDRWFRNISDFYKVQEQLDACRVRWIAAAEPNISMDTREGRLNLNIMLSIGQNEVDTTSERIRFTVQHMVQNGRLIFGEGNMPFGYMARREGGEKRMVKNPAESPVAADIFRYFLSNPCKKDTLEHIRRVHGLSFSYTRLNTMLSSEFYKGTYRGIPYCPAYVSEERWARLQQISKKNIKHAPSGRIYYFSGTIRCPVCGQILCGTGCRSIINRKTGEKRDYCYYRCNRAMIDRICTNTHKVSQNLVEKYLLDNLENEFEAYKIRVEDIKQQKKKEPLVRTEEQIEKEMERLNILFQKGRVSWDYYSQEYDSLEKEKSDLKKVIIEPERDYSFIEGLLQEDFRGIYSSLNPENKRTFWKNTIRQIHLKKDYTVDHVDFI